MERPGEQFLHQRDSTLHTSQPVEHEVERMKDQGERVSQKPADKLAEWMGVLEKTHLGHRDDPRVLDRIKESYYNKYVIDPKDIPESYYENQRRIARERGQGDIETTDDMRRQSEEVIIADQKSTIDNWLDYFMSSDSDSYPMWSKYWAFTGMLKLSTFDKEKHAFASRDKNTVAPFPDINREALAYVIDSIIKKVNKENIPAADDNPEFKKILEGANFGKLYTWAIEKVTPTEESELSSTKGEWVKYDQGSDHMPLVESLQGYGTGWCTAGEETAKHQLQGGDFYVYYSYDETGQPKIPRVAIRMEGDNIGEVRGIAADQNLDPYIADSGIIENKLKEFGQEGESYNKKSADMKRLTQIDSRHKKGEELSGGDLRFLYEIDGEIQGFGYGSDPRIFEILKDRDTKGDLSIITGYSRDQISTTQEEAFRGDIKYHYGNLYRYGVLDLDNLTSVERLTGLTLPKSISGNLNLESLILAKGLILPEHIGGDLDLSNLTLAEGLKLPESVGGDLRLEGLISAEGLDMPKSVGGYLNLHSLTLVKGLILPKSVGGDLSLEGLTSTEGLTLPEHVGGDIYLNSLQSEEVETLREKYPNLKLKLVY